MPLARVASRYAKSLIDLAEELNALEDVEKDMIIFKNTCESSRELRVALANPIIKHDKKLAILKHLFKDVHKITGSFFNILTKKGRENLLFDISVEFANQLRTKRGIEQAKLATAIELSDEQKETISKLLAKAMDTNIELKERVEEDLIGGFILNFSGKQIDSSVKSELNRIKNKFLDTTYINKL